MTIIVLLILAAVSIATLTGDNGILTKANTAKTTNDSAQAEEEMKLLVADWQLEKRSNSRANLGEFLNSKKANGELDNVTNNGDGSYTIEVNGYDAIISDEDGLEEIEKVEPEIPLEGLQRGEIAKTTKKDNYIDENGNKATVPEGFKVSDKKERKKYTEDKVDTGLVVIAPDESEFVWVPVPYVVANSEAEAIKKDGEQIVGKAMAVKQLDGTYRGILYDFEGTTSSVMTGCTTTNFDGNSGYKEPAISNFDGSSTYNPGYFDETSLKNEYKAMVESVEEYGGFYVGRYETSYDGTNVASKRGETPMSAEDDSQMWYGMYNKQKNYASSIKVNEKEVVGSSMIWGSQWDAIMNWMLTSDIEKSKVTVYSTVYQGNTGNPNDVMNKIYDLGNNLTEWTLENQGNITRTCRGGGGNYYWETPSSRNNGTPTTVPYFAYNYNGSRLTLYIK